MDSIKEKIKVVFEGMKGEMGYKSSMQSPRVEKVVISTGVGSVKDKKRLELIEDRLAKIAGQKPSVRGAKVSIANFKTRKGDTAGYQITLRGSRMVDFLDRFLNISLPRSKDFKGISNDSLDEMGNITIGLKEHTIFPETSDEDLKDVFGLSITVITTARNKKEAKMFLEKIGFPFKKK